MIKLYQIHITLPLKDNEGIRLLIDNDENIYWLDKESNLPYNSFLEADYLEYLASTLQNTLDAELSHYSFGLSDLSQAYCFGNEQYRAALYEGAIAETPTTLADFFEESSYEGYSDLITGLISIIEYNEEFSLLSDIDLDSETESELSLNDIKKILDQINNSKNSDKLQEKYFSGIMNYICNEFDTIPFEIALSDLLGLWNPSNQEIYEYFEQYDDNALDYIRNMIISEKKGNNILFNETITKKELSNLLELHGYSSDEININRLLYGFKKLYSSKENIFNYYLSNNTYNPLNLYK